MPRGLHHAPFIKAAVFTHPLMVGALAGLALAGCSGDDKELPYTEDIRVDAVPDSFEPESSGTRMCITREVGTATIYVLFMDNRNQPNEDRVDIWLNRSVDLGKTWLLAPIKVNQGDGSNVWNPDLYCNELGVFVVWEDDRDGELENHQIYFNYSLDRGETFAAEDQLLEDDPEGNTSSKEPQIEGFGQSLFVTWMDDTNGAFDVLVNKSDDAGGSWDSIFTRIDSDIQGSAFSAHPQIALGNNADDVYVVWEESRDGSSDVYFAHSGNGGTGFDVDVRLDKGDPAGEHNSFEPKLCVDGSHVYAVWHDTRNGDGRDIYVNYSADAGGTWLAAAQRLESDPPGQGNSLYPQCVVEGPALHTTWYDQRAENLGTDIYYRKMNAGLANEDEVWLDRGIPIEGYANSVHPQIALESGTVIVAWQDGRGEVELTTENGYDDLYYNYATPSEDFNEEGDFRIDSMYDGRSWKKDLNIDVLGGTWFAAWTDGRFGTGDIFFQSFPLGEASKPPNFEDLEAQRGE